MKYFKLRARTVYYFYSGMYYVSLLKKDESQNDTDEIALTTWVQINKKLGVFCVNDSR